MKRRTLLAASVASAAAPFAAPALARGVQQWRLVTSWPKNLPGPGVAAQMLADRITALSNGRIEVKLFAAGELVPSLDVFDAVSEGAAELYHSVPAYWGSKSRGILLFGSQPFGLRADEMYGWIVHGGGQALYDEMYGRFELKPFLCGNSGPQWMGWFRNELRSVDDLRDLRFRTTGLASEVATKLGVAVQAMGGAEMFKALKSGALDAGEFVGPWTDSALRFHEICRYYYWPGVFEPSSAEECAINADVYSKLPEDLKMVVAVACSSLYGEVWTEYTTNHARALPQLVAKHDVQVRQLPEDLIIKFGNAAGEVVAELREDSDELVRRITESFLAHRALVSDYMVYADNGQMNARILNYKY